jgi:hypothetical protein
VGDNGDVSGKKTNEVLNVRYTLLYSIIYSSSALAKLQNVKFNFFFFFFYEFMEGWLFKIIGCQVILIFYIFLNNLILINI